MSRINGSGVVFATLIALLTILSIAHEYYLNFDEVFKYILISISILSVLIVGVSVCYVCSVQIHTMLDNKHAEARHRLTSESMSVTSADFRSNIAVIQMMERLSQFSDCAVKTLPSYHKAMFSSFPVEIATDQVQLPPPPYTAITMPSALLEECPPPPNYDAVIATDNEEELPEYPTTTTTTSQPHCSDPEFCTHP